MRPRNVGHSGNMQSRRRDEQWGIGELSRKVLLYLQLVAATPIGSSGSVGIIQQLFCWTLVL